MPASERMIAIGKFMLDNPTQNAKLILTKIQWTAFSLSNSIISIDGNVIYNSINIFKGTSSIFKCNPSSDEIQIT